MTVRFAKKLEALPHYEGGMDIDRARRTYEASDGIKLASNESPWGPHPAVLERPVETLSGVGPQLVRPQAPPARVTATAKIRRITAKG